MKKKMMVMERFKMLPAMFIIYIFSSTHMFCFGANVSAYESKMETYIVQLKKPAAEKLVELEELGALYGSFVPQHRIVHSYSHVMTGFAARLTAAEAEEMENKEGLVSIRPQRILSLQTTYTPTFLGLKGPHPQVWDKTNFGKGVIIGVLDTGITPNHPSFNGEKIGPPPEKWKGQCDYRWLTVCNNKVIGTRNMVDDKPPIDEMGHGTHIASIAAGYLVDGASFAGAASGIAAGMAPHAHLAIYKVCSSLVSCEESAVIKGMEAAIVDGVDVISLSIAGSTSLLPLDEDPLSNAAFAAVKKGILVTCAAGNSGPGSGTITNVSPWMLTVGASTIDRTFPATVTLGTRATIVGESLVKPTSFDNFDQSRYMLLVFPGKDGDEDAKYCRKGSLTHFNVGGKVVLCETSGGITGRVAVAMGEEVKRLDGKAMILINSKRPDGLIMYDQHVLPTLHVSYEQGRHIQDYIEVPGHDMATAKISFQGTTFGSLSAPMVAEFSSRGPNPLSYEVIKPNIIGPGVMILGAWLNTENNDIEKNPTFAMLSGTSMATAHLSGIVALLKSSHPDWTPHVIMSAIITTAYTKNIGNKPITNYDTTRYRNEEYIESSIFDMGAGHVDPSRANEPGLVYPIDIPEDFDRKPILSELNYPWFSIALDTHPKSITVNRIVTNVGPKEATYTAHIAFPEGVDISLSINKLEFYEGVERLSYSVTFRRQKNVVVRHPVVQGHLKWVFNKKYKVRSPIVITFVNSRIE